MNVWFSDTNILAERETAEQHFLQLLHLFEGEKGDPETGEKKLPVRLVDSRISVSQVNSAAETRPLSNTHTHTSYKNRERWSEFILCNIITPHSL